MIDLLTWEAYGTTIPMRIYNITFFFGFIWMLFQLTMEEVKKNKELKRIKKENKELKEKLDGNC